MNSARPASSRGNGHRRQLGLWAGLVLGWLIAATAGAYALGETARKEAAAELARQSEAAAALHAAVLRSELEKYRALAPAMATDADVARLLTTPRFDARPLNQRLEALADQTRASAIYVIGADGVTRAASNWNHPVTFIGADYSFRPYFNKAMRDGSAEFFALGTVSGKPGLFLARRVVEGARAIGVVVVKVEFDALEAEWRASGEPAYVVDPGGVVLITSIPDWRFRTLRPMDAESRRLTLADQTLTDGALKPLPFHTPQGGKTQRVEAPLEGVPRPWMHARVDTMTPGWTLHLLTPDRGAIETNVANARTLAVLIATLAFGVAAVLLRRRQQAAARQRTAEAARLELERRIEERTHDLRQANIALNRQIEERVRAEASREALRDELVQAGKLAALGQIAAGVAHEINQPVAAIRTQAETASAYLQRDQGAKAARALSRIGDLTARIGAITHELRVFSRKAEPQLRPVSLNEAIDGALLLLGGRLRQAGVRLTRPRGEDMMVVADRFRLEQVIVNLMQNAAEALEGRPDGHITLAVERIADQVELRVADNGPGVTDEIRDQLFTPFVTSKANGLGLGLVISRDIVAGFGGELDLRSAAAGAAFTIRLKAA
ncbi:sensor histidine kinase [Brevundimonas guildfordensis]|uniref:histidine kinase n=1 Tax=Brevundimonas guildfordensis TaxID=2762241 RepID=A0ABR8R113_9CAUL|nr:ATP-binding protein [Brevundimonas guildfordensis]MBD7941413.1 sensor histidine kinase [Brevundimonas guildfordensis]